MGCSTCGGKNKGVRTPGGTARNPILFGDADGRAPQVATFLMEYPPDASRGQYRYVAGAGVEQAIEDGIIVRGYANAPTAATQAAPKPPPSYYVVIGKNQWIGFHNREAAERYAKIRGATVETVETIVNNGDVVN